MDLFEGYKKAVEIYNKFTKTQDGRKYVTRLNTFGVSKEYMEWVTTNAVVSKIPLYLILNAYKDWRRYVVKYYKDNNMQIPNINQLDYSQVVKITNECKRKYAKPNPIYDKDGIYVGVLTTFEMANMLPINTTWCITKTPQRHKDFNNDKQKCLYIQNSKNSDPFRRVIAVCSMNDVEYWDSTNHRMNDKEVMSYEKTLPIEVENIIHNFAYQMNNQQLNCNTNMNKKLIKLTEGDLHRIVKESVNKVLTELDWRTYANAARKRVAQADSSDDIETRRRLGQKAYDLDRATERALKNQYGANSVVDTKYNRQDFNTYDTNDPFNFSTDYSTRGAESYKEYDPYGGPYSDDKNRYKGSKEISDFVKGKNKYIKGQGWQ